MRKLVRNNPLEALTAIAGVIVTVLGAFFARESDWKGLAGILLTIVGTALMSVVSTAMFASGKATTELRKRIAILRNQLTTATSQVSGALQAALLAQETAETTFSRINQSVGVFATVLQEFDRLAPAGEKDFASDALLAAKRQLVDLGSALDRLRSEVSDSESDDTIKDQAAQALLNIIESAQDKVADALASLAETSATRTYVVQAAACPSCGRATKFQLGSAIGDSAMPTCPYCGVRFHAHRRQDGIATRLPGSRSTVEGVLARHNMVLLPRQERRRYLEIIEQAYADGQIKTASDITNVIDVQIRAKLPSRVRMPLFYALVNREYGIVSVPDDPTLQLRDRPVAEFHASCPCGSFVRHAEAAWLAQAIYRLWGYGFDDEQLLDYFFGPSGAGEAERKLFGQAKDFAAYAIRKTTTWQSKTADAVKPAATSVGSGSVTGTTG